MDNLPFKIKRGVDHQMVHSLIWCYAYHIAVRHKQATGYRMVITSMTRLGSGSSYHNPFYADSQHNFGTPVALSTAFDMRRWYFHDFQHLEEFCLQIKQELDIGCLIEPEWMTANQIAKRGGIDKIAPHVHWQLSTRNRLWLSPLGSYIRT